MSTDTYDLTVERVLDAAVEDVFDAYTSPEAGRTVFAGGPDWAVEVTCDLRVGGVWSITSGPPNGEPYRETNRFSLIDRPHRLAFESTMTMPDGSSFDRDVEVTFKREDGGTRMTMVHKGFPTAEVRDAFGAGLSSIFDPLERVAQA
jgi:glutathione S-transferase